MNKLFEKLSEKYQELVGKLPVCVRHPDICGFLTAVVLIALILVAVVTLTTCTSRQAEAADDVLDYGTGTPLLLMGVGLELNEKFTRPPSQRDPDGEEGNPIGYADISWCPPIGKLQKTPFRACAGYRHHSSAPQENDWLTVDELYTEVQFYFWKYGAIQARYGLERDGSLGDKQQWSVGARLCGGGTKKDHWFVPCTGYMHTQVVDDSELSPWEEKSIDVWYFGIGFNVQSLY